MTVYSAEKQIWPTVGTSLTIYGSKPQTVFQRYSLSTIHDTGTYPLWDKLLEIGLAHFFVYRNAVLKGVKEVGVQNFRLD